MLNQLPALSSTTSILLSVIDVLIVTFVIYKGILLIKGTRAVQLIKGLVVLLIASALSHALELTTFQWLLDKAWTMLFVALPIVFQPELRRALEQLGRGKFFAKSYRFLDKEALERVINEIARGVGVLAKNNIGALIVIERETGLIDYIDTGIKIDGVVSAEFLVSIFTPKTPLHDGAVIMRGDRIVAAGSFLPLSDSPYISKALGTRHRAALGLSEQTDAICIVVSEETGVISVASNGQISRYLEEATLSELLKETLGEKNTETNWLGRKKT
ncbi:MAG: diadenylate cyclase CdaA [Bacillota bacterium]|nr:diadenylate cyclase CdaA [Bacillota bacterium]